MKFLADQDVYQITIEFLAKLGHDILRAREAGLSAASDEKLLLFAKQEQCILITRDKGFGNLVFMQRHENCGVILLRMNPASIAACHKELTIFLHKHATLDLHKRFCVIEPGCHRIRMSS